MKPVFYTLLAGLVVACATAENQSPFDDGDDVAGSSGSGVGTAGTNASTSGSSSGGSGTGGTPPATGGQPTAGTQSTGGMVNAAGTGFLPGGTNSGGTGGTATGGTGGGTGGTGTAGTGGKASGGTGGTGTAGTGGKASGGTGGTATGGTGGTGNQVGCGPKTGWTATAMPEGIAECAANPTATACGPAIRGIDGVTNNRFTTATARLGTEWYQIDFGKTVSVTKVVLNTANASTDFTHAYEVKMAATEGELAAAPVIVMGDGVQGTTTINFPSAQSGRVLRIYQKTAIAGWWSLAEVDVTCE